MSPPEDKAPAGGFNPVTPFSAAHPIIEKDVSVPIAAAQKPADTATADPVLEPPASLFLSYAFFTCPPLEL